MIETIDISGTSISAIHDEATQLSKDDLFLLSQQCLSNTSIDRTYECNGTTYNNEYQSLNERYETLSSQFYDSFYKRLSLKSMAWESSADYSGISHAHHYSTCECTSFYGDKTTDVTPIAVMTIDSTKYIFKTPDVKVYQQPKPVIGQLKFLAIANATHAIDENAPGFDGWVWADGRALNNSKFKKAWQVFGSTFGGDPDTGMFNIPSFSTMLELDPTPPVDNDARRFSIDNPEDKVVLKHPHTAQSFFSGTMDVTLSIGASDNWKIGESTHSPNSSTQPTISCTASYAFRIKNATVVDQPKAGNSLASLDVPSYPSFISVPALIYIGVD